MKHRSRRFLLWGLAGAFGLLVIAGMAMAAAPTFSRPFLGCMASGDTQNIKLQHLNYLKNRSTAPAKIDSAVTLKAMLAPGNDRHRWSNGDGASITGYVILVKPGGMESVNCHAKSMAHRDTHIEVAQHADASNVQAVVVEVTPGWRSRMLAHGVDWSTRTLGRKLTGHRVTFTGWLFFDVEHANAAENTNPGAPHDWRGTAWEIHPVTVIRLLN